MTAPTTSGGELFIVDNSDERVNRLCGLTAEEIKMAEGAGK